MQHDTHQNTIATTFAELLIGGLMIGPAFAAVKWSDISLTTHGVVSAPVDQQFGRSNGKFCRADISSVTHSAVPAETQQISKTSVVNYSRSDLTAITRN